MLQHKTLESRLDILTLILIAMYYYFFFSKFLRSTFNLEKKAFATYKQPALFTVALFFKVYIYIYLKNMYITLKGIGKILFVSVLKIFLICKFLNFTAHFH